MKFNRNEKKKKELNARWSEVPVVICTFLNSCKRCFPLAISDSDCQFPTSSHHKLSTKITVIYLYITLSVFNSFSILQPRQNLLGAANRVGETQNALLRCMGSTGDVDPRFQVQRK